MNATWTVPSRLPTRAALAPQHPVHATHVGNLQHTTCMGRAHEYTDTGTTTAPTVRELLDHCVSKITAALRDGDPSTAALYHRAARLLHDASASTCGTPDRP